MSAARYDFTIEQGTYFELPMTWKDAAGAAIDNTGFAFKLQAKDAQAGTLIIDLSNGAGITVGGTDGKITFYMAAADTATLDFDILPYNIEYVPPSGKAKRFLQGFITLSKDVYA